MSDGAKVIEAMVESLNDHLGPFLDDPVEDHEARAALRAALEAVSEKSLGNVNEGTDHTWDPIYALRALIAATYPEADR